jgi:chromosome segregation ATPase
MSACWVPNSVEEKVPNSGSPALLMTSAEERASRLEERLARFEEAKVEWASIREGFERLTVQHQPILQNSDDQAESIRAELATMREQNSSIRQAIEGYNEHGARLESVVARLESQRLDHEQDLSANREVFESGHLSTLDEVKSLGDQHRQALLHQDEQRRRLEGTPSSSS